MATTRQQIALLYTADERSEETRWLTFSGEPNGVPLETRLLRRLKRRFGRRPLRTPSKRQRALGMVARRPEVSR